jgi:selenide,water dikinase
VLPHTDAGAVGEEDLILLADAQASGGLLVAGELPRAPVIGELIPPRQRSHHPVISRPGSVACRM